MGVSHTFHKSERLTQKKVIESIFNKQGKSIHANDFLLVYLETQLYTKFPAQVLISVSKRKFKKAHDRNRIKRILREAYRLNKHHIYAALSGSEKQFALALLYLSKEEVDFTTLEKQLKTSINEFIKRVS